jgi:hypothetical protein
VLTCKQCNNRHGRGSDVRLRNYVKANTYDPETGWGALEATVRTEASGEMGPEIRTTFKLGSDGGMTVAVVKRQNNPADLKVNNELMNSVEGGRRWHMQLSLGYSNQSALHGFLRSAYLFAMRVTRGRYAYTPGGEFVRSLLDPESNETIPKALLWLPDDALSRDNWMGWLVSPPKLRCCLVKVAKKVIILPPELATDSSCYDAWEEISFKQDELFIFPSRVKLEMVFTREIDARNAYGDISNVIGGQGE